jgi:hypothetical protein
VIIYKIYRREKIFNRKLKKLNIAGKNKFKTTLLTLVVAVQELKAFSRLSQRLSSAPGDFSRKLHFRFSSNCIKIATAELPHTNSPMGMVLLC